MFNMMSMILSVMIDWAIIVLIILCFWALYQIYKEEVKFIPLKDDVIIPTKDKENAGYDIYANFEEENLVIKPHETVLVPTKLSTIFPSDYVMLLRERGSTGSKGMALRAGVVDSNYRGEIFVGITNTNNIPIVITKEKDKEILSEDYIVYPYEKAIAQAIFVRLFDIKTTVGTKEDLEQNKTSRGTGALGSSGK